MKKIAFALMLMVISIMFFLILGLMKVQAQTQIPQTRVAVYSLKLTGSYYNYNNFEQYLKSLIETKLSQAGIVVLARGQDYKDIIAEQNLPGIDPNTQAPKNQLWGATATLELTGNIVVNRLGGGFGFRIGNTKINVGSQVSVTFKLSGQMVDVRTGRKFPAVAVASRKGALESFGFYVNNFGGIVFNDNIKESLLGKAAEEAINRIVDEFIKFYNQIPSQESWPKK